MGKSLGNPGEIGGTCMEQMGKTSSSFGFYGLILEKTYRKVEIDHEMNGFPVDC